jgi:hypothetical protein
MANNFAGQSGSVTGAQREPKAVWDCYAIGGRNSLVICCGGMGDSAGRAI